MMTRERELLEQALPMLEKSYPTLARKLCDEVYEVLAAQPAPVPMTQAATDVLAERKRQVEVEGWNATHDDEHDDHSMSVAAACYALANRPALEVQTVKLRDLWQWTGWSIAWFKPKDRRRNLIRAAALLLAEIERLDRAGIAASPEQKP